MHVTALCDSCRSSLELCRVRRCDGRVVRLVLRMREVATIDARLLHNVLETETIIWSVLAARLERHNAAVWSAQSSFYAWAGWTDARGRLRVRGAAEKNLIKYYLDNNN